MAFSRAALLVACLAMLAVMANAGVGAGGKCDLTGNASTRCNSPLTCATGVEGGRCCMAPFVITEGDYCNVGSSVCCMDSLECKNNKCAKKGPPPCTKFEPVGGSCNLAAGICCGGNHVSCTSGRCISSMGRKL